MRPASYECVRYEPGHRDLVLDLQSHHWGPERDLNDRLFAWKYEQNPWRRDPLVYLVFHGSQLVAMRGFYGSRWEAGAPREEFEIPSAADLVILESHRDRGIYTQLMQRALADIAREPSPFLFNLSAGPAARLGAITMGWREIGPIPVVRWSSPRRSGTGTPSDPFATIDGLLSRGGQDVRESVWLAAHAQAEAMASLVRHRPYDGRIRHVRDTAYFAWCFRHPRRRFRFLFHRGQGDIDGYLVLAVSLHHDSPVKIVDCEGSPEVVTALLSAAVQDCGLQRVVAWRPTIAQASAADLNRLGFVELPVKSVAEPYTTVLMMPNARPATAPWTLAGRDVVDPRHWDLRQAFGDGG